MNNRIVFIFLLISMVFHLKGQETTKLQSSLKNNLFCDQIQDEQLKIKCEKFNQALLDKRLTSPKGESAYDLFLELEKAKETQGLAPELKSELLAALQNEIQSVMAIAPRLPMEELTIKLVFNRSYQGYLEYIEAIAYLTEAPSDQPFLQLHKHYFEGLSLREKVKSLQSKDTTLLKSAIRKQMSALENNLESPYPYLELGRLFFELGAYGQAGNFYNRVIKKAPDWAVPLLGVSQLYVKLKDEKRALALAQQINAQNLHYGIGHLNSARVNAIFEKPENSLAQYKNAVKQLVSDYRSQPEGFKLFALYQLAEIAIEFEIYDRAEFFLKIILQQRKAPELYLLLGQVYEYTNRTLSADSLYRICIQKWPENIGAYHRQGVLYHSLGRYREAMQYYQKVNDLNPRHREVCYNLGSLQHLFKQREEAKKLYRQALLYPKGMQAMYGVLDTIVKAFNTKSKGSYKMELINRMQEPDSFFMSNVGLPADEPISDYEDYIYYQLGNAYFEQDSTDEKAGVMYKTAVLLNPGLEEAYKNLIQLLWYKEEYQQALIFSELYKLYVPYSQENKDDQQLISNIARAARKKGAKPLSEQDQGVYTFFLDNFWPYIYNLNRTEAQLDLYPQRLNREKRIMRQMMNF